MCQDCYIAMQFTQSLNSSNFHKMPYSRHFIPFSVFSVSQVKKSFSASRNDFYTFDTYII